MLSTGLTALRQTILTGVGVAAADALSDLRPGSGALTEVNGVDEGPLFPRYGIQHYASKRWMPMRLAGDYVSNPQGLGTLFVGFADVLFLGASGGAIIGFFTGHWGFTLFCVRLMRAMLNSDNWWARLTAGNDRTDGVVEGTSQVYPDALLNRAATTATSHLGETDTERSYVELNTVLAERLNVVRRRPL